MTLILVTGSRDFTDEGLLDLTLRRTLTELVPDRPTDTEDLPVLREGEARGLDKMAAKIWTNWGLPLDPMAVDDWTRHGQGCPKDRSCWIAREDGVGYCRRAGFTRNEDMCAKLPRPDVVLAFLVHGLPCNGTRHCAGHAEDMGLEVRYTTQGG